MKTIKEHQDHVKFVVKDKGFDKETPHQVLGLLVEEVGEMAKALRKLEGIKTGPHSKTHDIEEEAADVLFMLLDFCNRMDVNLQSSFKAKIKKIQARKNG
jgi:NTP pyrophosphatase (non-canonical NTP hydrolase)